MTISSYTLTVIGVVESCFKQKFGIPRQPGLAPSAKARILLHPPYNDPDAFDGLSQCTHLWLQFIFHKMPGSTQWKPKVRPPRLGGNQALGVFATRSPNRPNPIGLSVVKYDGLSHESNQLYVNISGIDLLDKTPILDIKPYVPYVDIVCNAENTVAPEQPKIMTVKFSESAACFCQLYEGENNLILAKLIAEVLQQDPRPQYQKASGDRVYGMLLYDLDVRWLYKTVIGEQIIWVEAVSLT